MKNTIIGIFLILSLINMLNAQNCSNLVEWSELIEKEFPGLDTDRIRNGSKQSNRILFNLYSDTYFIPFAGKPFDQISSSNRAKKLKKLVLCSQKKKYTEIKHLPWLRSIGLYPFSDARTAGIVAQKQIEFKKLRAVYSKTLNALNMEELELQTLNKYRNQLRTKLHWLLPSEITFLNNKINEKESVSADRTLLKVGQEIKNRPNTYATLSNLLHFERQNKEALTKASSISQQKFRSEIRQKNTMILKTLMLSENNAIEKITEDFSSIARLNTFRVTFNQKYLDFKEYASVQSVYRTITDIKTKIITSHAYQIQQKIDKTVKVEELERLKVIYFKNTRTENTSIISLNTRVKKRVKIILERERQQKIARLAKDKLRQQQFNNGNEKRKKIIAQQTSLAQNLRKTLRFKYESNFPTFDDLFEIMQNVKAMGDRSTSETKNKFIASAERLGYMLNNRNGKVYSDFNGFKNSKGFEIKTIRSKGSATKTALFFTELVIANAPKDIIDMYYTELTTYYRKYNQSQIVSMVLNSKKDFDSKFYIKSGGTYYSVSLKAGKLRVSATDNIGAKGLAYAERLDANTVKVTPFSNVTDIFIKEGDEIKFRASGTMKLGAFLGVFAGPSSPNGIKGYRNYNVVSRFNHGSLMGKIGNDPWFLIGQGTTIKATTSGPLSLQVNDTKVNDNDGFFNVYYSFL